MRATRWGRWGLVLALVFAAPASAAQVIAPRDVAARLAVGPDGRAFVVSPSARPDSNALSPIRRRAARPGAAFGPSRALMRSAAGARPVDAGVAADGSGVIVVQAPAQRTRRRVRPRRSTRQAGRAVRARGPRRLRSVGGRPSGAAVVVWFRHRGARSWRLEAATREPGAAHVRPAPAALGLRAPSLLHERVGRDRGARRRRGDVELTARPAVWAAVGRPGTGSARTAAGRRRERRPRAVVGAGGAAAVIYSTQHVPLRTSDGLQLHRAAPGAAFGAAERVNRGGGVTVADAAVTPRAACSWPGAIRCTARASTCPRRGPASRWPPPPSWGQT